MEITWKLRRKRQKQQKQIQRQKQQRQKQQRQKQQKQIQRQKQQRNLQVCLLCCFVAVQLTYKSDRNISVPDEKYSYVEITWKLRRKRQKQQKQIQRQKQQRQKQQRQKQQKQIQRQKQQRNLQVCLLSCFVAVQLTHVEITWKSRRKRTHGNMLASIHNNNNNNDKNNCFAKDTTQTNHKNIPQTRFFFKFFFLYLINLSDFLFSVFLIGGKPPIPPLEGWHPSKPPRSTRPVQLLAGTKKTLGCKKKNTRQADSRIF